MVKIYKMITKFNKYKLFENPNTIAIATKDGIRDLDWVEAKETTAFSYYFGDFYYNNQTHYELLEDSVGVAKDKHGDEEDFDERRKKYFKISGRGECSGRLFPEYKILTFWRFPKDKEELKKVCADIKKNIGYKVWEDDEWRIEVIGEDDPSYYWGSWEPSKDDISYIPLKDYKSSKDRSEEEMNIVHLMNPEEKEAFYKKNGKPRGFGSDLKAKRNPIEWEQAKRTSENVIYPNKMAKIAEDELTKTPGGRDYFDNIDAALKLPKNLDIIKSIFKQIQKEQGTHFNLILTGGFGDWVMSLIKKGVLNVPGNLVSTNGSLRAGNDKLGKTSKGKDVDVIHKKNDIENQKFIMFDDSYYSGSTKNSLDKFLKKYNSEIYKTYVLYDGNDEVDPDRRSLYRYYDYHTGTKLGVDMLIDYLYSLDVDIPLDIIRDKIIKGVVKTIKDVRDQINFIYQKFGKKPLDKLTHKETRNIVKSFESFEIEEEMVFIEGETTDL